MAFKHITSRDNPIFKQLKKLSDNAKTRRTEQQTLLDGVHLIESYLKLFGEPELIIIPEGQSSVEATALIHQFDDDLIMMVPTLMFAEMTPVATATGILALVSKPHLPTPEQPNFVLLIEDIQDPGNLGSMIRTAAAAGVEAVYLSEGCTDAWSPKCLRGGQGAQFVLPIVERVDLVNMLQAFNGHSFATVIEGESIYQHDLSESTAIVIGNEGAGLRQQTVNACTHRLSIPMASSSVGGVESLNAGAATAIVVFEKRRQSLD
jgi:RNA methyltransferase, TrmH family